MILHHTAQRSCRLLAILRTELGLSTTLIQRLKYQNAFTVNSLPVHTNYPVLTGDEIAVVLDEAQPDFPRSRVRSKFYTRTSASSPWTSPLG